MRCTCILCRCVAGRKCGVWTALHSTGWGWGGWRIRPGFEVAIDCLCEWLNRITGLVREWKIFTLFANSYVLISLHVDSFFSNYPFDCSPEYTVTTPAPQTASVLWAAIPRTPTPPPVEWAGSSDAGRASPATHWTSPDSAWALTLSRRFPKSKKVAPSEWARPSAIPFPITSHRMTVSKKRSKFWPLTRCTAGSESMSSGDSGLAGLLYLSFDFFLLLSLLWIGLKWVTWSLRCDVFALEYCVSVKVNVNGSFLALWFFIFGVYNIFLRHVSGASASCGFCLSCIIGFRFT